MANADTPGFEGPEKKFEIDFRRGVGEEDGLFVVSDEKWQKLLDLAKCEIIAKNKGAECKMYVLSESSLFVYKRKVVAKTCGTTTLLEMIPALLQVVSSEKNDWNAEFEKPLSLETEYMCYSRKNFLWPHLQPRPHGSFHDEIRFLEKHFPGGEGYVLGPLNKEHWNFFLADYTRQEDSLENPPDQTLEIIMTGLSEEKMKIFFDEDGTACKDAVTASSGIDNIIPGSTIDAKMFQPCGYSMNGLTNPGHHYWTIHVTPENHCSYVSFETNLPQDDYTPMIERVLSVFDPSNVVVTLFADSHSLPSKNGAASPLPKSLPGLQLKHKTSYDFSAPYWLTLLDFRRA